MTATLDPPRAPPELREAARLPAGGRRVRPRTWAVLGALAVVASLVPVALAPGPLVRPEGLGLVGDALAGAAAPRLDAEFLTLVGSAALTTLAYAVLGTLLAVALGLVGGVLSSEVWWCEGRRGAARRRGVACWVAVRAALVVPRAIHEVVWGLLLLAVLGLTPLVAVLAIAVPFGAISAKVFSELLDSAPRRPYTAALAGGASRPVALLYTLVPGAWPDLLAYGFYRFECAIRSAAILGLVGAGGLGFELALSLQTLDWAEAWTVLYALILLGAATDVWSSTIRRRRSARTSLAVALALVVGALVWVRLDLSVLVGVDTWRLVAQTLGDAWPPQLGAGGLGELLGAAALTVAMSVLAIALASTGAAVLAFPAAATGTVTLVVTRVLLLVLRALPPPLWALLVLFVTTPGLLPGALALGIYTLGVLGRLQAEAVENLDPRPQRALHAVGAPRAAVFAYGVLPAAAPRFVAFGLYRWEVTIRETVVVGVVGAGGLGLLLGEQLASFAYAAAATTLATLVVLTMLVDATSAAVRRSLA